ncbi:MAG TPA: class I SAM-dependent methyltransferase [Bryobacteraceae bacterium]
MSVRVRLYRFYWWLEKRIVPGHASSQYVYWRELKQNLCEAAVWLDLGCGRHLFTEWMTAEQQEMIRRSKQLVGIDLNRASLLRHEGLRDRVEGSLERLPFRDGAFDLVTANMVVEHLRDAHEILHEIRRVLKPGGLFIFHTPNYLNFAIFGASLVPQALKNRLVRLFEKRREEDVFPTFYRMNTPKAIRHVGAEVGFSVVRLTLTDTSALTVILGPIVILELLWIRLCRREGLRNLRSNIVAVLRNSPASGIERRASA